MKFKIHEYYIEEFNKKMNKLKNKFKKYNKEFIFNIIGEEFIESKHTKDKFLKFYEVEIEGSLKNGDYEVVALIEHEKDGNIIKLFKDIEIPLKYRQTKSYCDHCGHKRFRKDTVLLYNNIEYKQVGKSCLKDYIGIDATIYGQWYDLLTEINNKKDKFELYSKDLEYFKTQDIIYLSIELINKNGFTPKTSMIEGMLHYNDDSTAEQILNNLDLTYIEDKELYNKISNFIENMESTDFNLNLKSIFKNDYIRKRNIGMLACAYHLYLKNKDVEKNQNISKHIGESGDKVEFEGSLELRNSYPTDYGISYIYKLVDDEANIYEWKTSNKFENNNYFIRGTIKYHKIFNKMKINVLTRYKVKEKTNDIL